MEKVEPALSLLSLLLQSSLPSRCDSFPAAILEAAQGSPKSGKRHPAVGSFHIVTAHGDGGTRSRRLTSGSSDWISTRPIWLKGMGFPVRVVRVKF